jgi:hypothetical protein
LWLNICCVFELENSVLKKLSLFNLQGKLMSVQTNRSLLKASVLLFTSLFIFNAQAGVVNSTLALTTINPDISAGFITATYVGDSTSGVFTANGEASQLTTVTPTNETIDGGTFSLNANIQESAGTADGLLSIGGTIAALGFNSNTLITGTLLQVGGPNIALNFLFNVTGGDAAALYGGIGSTIGVIMNFTGYDGGFNAAFNSTNPASADTFSVEVSTPNSLSIFLIGFLALGLRKKLRG